MSEELQRYQKSSSGLICYEGEKIDSCQRFILGSTTLAQLKQADIIESFTNEIVFKPRLWNGSPTPSSKPDELILDGKTVKLVVERKTKAELSTQKKEETAAEQCLVYTQQLHCQLGVVTDYKKFFWINNPLNRATEIRYIFDEHQLYTGDYRQSGVLRKILDELDPSTDSIRHIPAIDPSNLADKVWQTIWLATHEEPKSCLATFVELFVYKFLSDLGVLPSSLKIEGLNASQDDFVSEHGVTQIEYYCQNVRPFLKKLFPEKAKFSSPIQGFLEGSDTTSIIDGFAFLEPGMTTHNHPLSSFNRSFTDIIRAFLSVGSITKIDSEFKSRVYEKFLKKNVKQQKLGQYLTPRNIVRAILEMADLKAIKLRQDAEICDPASGVGGFLLEPLLHENLLKDNLQVNDKVSWKVRLTGLEVDRQTNILAKANMLIHLAERYRALTQKQRGQFADLMNCTFILTDHDKMLGSLEFPQVDAFDLIMTNIPFVVRGTKLVKERIAESEVLEDHYNKSGMGIESLFIRYIIDSLKPGSSAFVIVPTGILTRTEISLRQYLRDNCEIDGIIALPKRSFYNTPNATYILAITKKTNKKKDQTSEVFAYIVREIGESRDVLRLPCRNDLKDMARQFKLFCADKELYEPRNIACKLIPIKRLDSQQRWDVDRVFWAFEEKRTLGLSETEAMTLSEFESATTSTTTLIESELASLKKENGAVTNFIEFCLGDSKHFELFRGNRVTRRNCASHPGAIPVISGRGKMDSYLGFVDEDWLKHEETPVRTKPLIVVAANGNVGTVFLREEPKYVIHDDAIGIDLVNKQLDPLYTLYALRAAIANSGWQYDAKLYLKRLSSLNIRVPVDSNGDIDSERQKVLAAKYESLERLKQEVEGLAERLQNRVIVAD